jgi:hypothetical protein
MQGYGGKSPFRKNTGEDVMVSYLCDYAQNGHPFAKIARWRNHEPDITDFMGQPRANAVGLTFFDEPGQVSERYARVPEGTMLIGTDSYQQPRVTLSFIDGTGRVLDTAVVEGLKHRYK